MVCLICSAPTNSQVQDSLGVNREKYSKISQRFLVHTSRYLDIDDIPYFPPAQTITATNDEGNRRSKVSCCDRCSTLVETYCNIYQQWSYFQLQLDWATGEIAGVMKDVDTPQIPRNRIEKSIAKFRSKFLDKVSDRRKSFPQLILERVTPPQKNSQRQQDNFQTLTKVKDEIPHSNLIHSTMKKNNSLKSNSSKFNVDRRFPQLILERVKLPQKNSRIKQNNFQNLAAVKEKISHSRLIKSIFKKGNSLKNNSSKFNANNGHTKSGKCISKTSCPRKDLSGIPTHTARKRKISHKRHKKDKSTKRQPAQNQEQISHGRNSLKCRLCERRFSSRQTLKFHEITHSGQNSHKCKYCGNGFYWEHQKTQHEKLHKHGRTILEKGRPKKLKFA